MLRKLWDDIHQSYFVVAMCIGVIVGSILGVALRINYFGSIWWCVLAVLLLAWAYIKPKFVFVIVAFLAGMILVFFKVSGELTKQNILGENYIVTAGLETEEWVINVRDWFAGRVKGQLPEVESSLGLSYLLGMKTGLPDSLSENLRAVGLAHIVVASGAHLSILVEVAKKIFGKISRTAGAMFSIIFVVFFMAMVGWTPSIMRAGVMSILTLIAWYVGRKIEPWRMIIMVAAFTLILNPMFVTNLGWLLSFASFIGIMMLGPKFVKFFYGTRKPGFVAETVLTTIAATIMTLPIVLYYFGQMSLISVIANLVLLPTLSWAMGLVFVSGLCLGVPLIGMAMAWCTTRMLDFHIAVVDFFGQMEYFLVKIPLYQPQVFLIYFLIMGGIFPWSKLVELSTKSRKSGRIKRS